mgnify:CR=1 FL=1
MFVAKITEAIREQVRGVLQQHLECVTSIKSSAPNNINLPNSIIPTSAEKTNGFKDKLAFLLEKRHKAFYQSLRHKTLINVLSNGLADVDPKVPRKFMEKIGRFDQAPIINKKKEMSKQNANNEIEILKIYYESDIERLQKVEDELKEKVGALNDNEQEMAKKWIEASILKNEKISNDIIEKKQKFFNSDKYLHPISKMDVNSSIEIKEVRTNYNNQMKFPSFAPNYKKPILNNNVFKERSQHSYSQVVQNNIPTLPINNVSNFQSSNQNFKRKPFQL